MVHELDRSVGQVAGEELVAVDADFLLEFVDALVLVVLAVHHFGDSLLQIVLFFVFSQAFDDVEALVGLAHQQVDDGDVVPQQDLVEVVLAAEYFLLQVFEQHREVLLRVQMEDH